MNTTSTRHTAATLASATAVAAALTIMSAIAPTAANAHRVDPFPDVGGVGSAGTVDFAVELAHRKAQMAAQRAQYYVDHALERHQRTAR